MESKINVQQCELSRRQFLRSAAAAAGSIAGLGLLPSICGAMAAKKKRPNVLFISIDDLRPQLGCYGQSQTLSPNLDRFAQEGVIFTNHFVQCPACAPSRYSLLTGLRPHRAKLKSYTMQAFDLVPQKFEGRPSLPHQFRRNGYYTVSIGKISHSPDGRKRGPSIQETDAYDGGATGEPELPFGWDEVYTPYGEWKTAWGVFFGYAGGKTRIPGKTPATEAADVPDTGYPDGLIAEEAIKKLRKIKDKQFFLAVGFYKPHLPFNSPKAYWDDYEADRIDLSNCPEPPKNTDPKISLHKSPELTPRYTGLATPGVVTKQEAQHLRHAYYSAVHYIDTQVGKVLGELDRLGLRDNTIVVVWGDNGWHLGDLGIWGKSTAYEFSLRTPLMVRAPGITAVNQKSKAVVESLDIYPTLCELCGLDVPSNIDGQSLGPLLRQPDRPGKNYACGYNKREQRLAETMRTERYRVVRWTDIEGRLLQTELYDHKTDPYETVNIAAQNQEVVQNLLAKMDRINSTAQQAK